MNNGSKSNLFNGNLSADEYGEYYSKYVKLSEGQNLFDQLEKNRSNLKNIFQGLSEKQTNHSYASGKWSIKEVLGHVIDTERIFNYRALAISRGEKVSLPGYDPNLYVENANFSDLSADNLLSDYDVVRDSTISLFRTFNDTHLLRRGNVGTTEFTVRALGYVVAGHEMHHLNVLNEKYLNRN